MTFHHDLTRIVSTLNNNNNAIHKNTPIIDVGSTSTFLTCLGTVLDGIVPRLLVKFGTKSGGVEEKNHESA